MTAKKSSKNRDEAMPTRQEALEKREPMTPQEILELLELRGWKQLDLATELQVSKSSVWRWVEGLGEPIPSLQRELRKLLDEAREANKKPKQKLALKTA